MHQNPDLRAVYDGRGFSRSRNFLFLCLLECFILFCRRRFCFLLPNSTSVSYTCTWVNHSHSAWWQQWGTLLLLWFYCRLAFNYFFSFLWHSSCFQFTPRCKNCPNLITMILQLSCYQLSSSILSLNELVLKVSFLKDPLLHSMDCE